MAESYCNMAVNGWRAAFKVGPENANDFCPFWAHDRDGMAQENNIQVPCQEPAYNHVITIFTW